jgi:nucleoside-diphosphate-sugar epimerase
MVGINVPLTRSRVLAMAKYWSMNINKARNDLGYHPIVDFPEGVARTVAWYKKNGWL